jgi:hypothetical protein
MSDLDPISELQGRLAQLETSLTHARTGKPPPQPVDLLAWRATATSTVPMPATGWRPPGWRLAVIAHILREDWRGMSQAIRTWAIRFEERLGR